MTQAPEDARTPRLAVPRKPTRSRSLNVEYAGQIAYASVSPSAQERHRPVNNPRWAYFLNHGWREYVRRASQHHEIHTDRQAQVHPNGIVYYHQDRLNVTTTANLREIDGWDPLVTLAQSNIGANANSAAVRASEGWEVLVELDGVTWIDHARQAASELNEDFMAFRERLRDLDGSASDPSTGVEYWSFVQRCPNHVVLTKLHWTEAYNALTWEYADRILFGYSNASFSKDDSKELLQVLQSLNSHHGPVQTWFIACIMRPICSDRQRTRYGQSDAADHRLRQREENPNDPPESHTWFMATLRYTVGSLLCLGIPHTYFGRIQRVDRTRFEDGVSTERWRSFISGLVKEWQDSSLVATVLIAANVSMLAIPAIDSVTRILSLISVMASAGSVISGMLFVWRHQSREGSSAEMGMRYFTRAKLRSNSSVPLSFVLAIPIVLLLWGFLGFLASVAVYAFRGTDGGGPLGSRFSLGTSIGVILMVGVLFGAGLVSWMFLANAWSPLSSAHVQAVLHHGQPRAGFPDVSKSRQSGSNWTASPHAALPQQDHQGYDLQQGEPPNSFADAHSASLARGTFGPYQTATAPGLTYQMSVAHNAPAHYAQTTSFVMPSLQYYGGQELHPDRSRQDSYTSYDSPDHPAARHWPDRQLVSSPRPMSIASQRASPEIAVQRPRVRRQGALGPSVSRRSTLAPSSTFHQPAVQSQWIPDTYDERVPVVPTPPSTSNHSEDAIPISVLPPSPRGSLDTSNSPSSSPGPVHRIHQLASELPYTVYPDSIVSPTAVIGRPSHSNTWPADGFGGVENEPRPHEDFHGAQEINARFDGDIGIETAAAASRVDGSPSVSTV